MDGHSRSTGSGFFVAIATFAGVAIGRIYGQTSIGMLAGFGIGVVIAIALWWRERR